MKYLILILLLLIGCSKIDEPICENNTIVINNTINKTITVFNETIKYINKTCNITQYEYKGTTSRELELIRRIKYLEGQQHLYFNDSECNWELNNTENKLKECEEELCEWNSSWC